MNNYDRIHLIGNAHIDPVWLWRWQDGFSEVRASFRSALDRMEEFDDFIFTCAGACYYRWIEENDPDMFDEIKERIAQGRWVIAGGLWIQPDMNIPSGESFARHILYSQRYYLEKFNRIAEFGYNVDSFGHNAMFPGILKKGKMDSYVFMRPGSHEKDLPSNLFYWKGIDGNQVLTFRIPVSYTTGYNGRSFIEKRIASYEEEGITPGEVMVFYGVGNHGGGPTIENLKEARSLMEKHGRDRIFFSSPTEYFKSVKGNGQDIPVVEDELQHHASGCYSAHSATKKYNRLCEERLITAEAFMTLSSLIAGYDNFGDKIQEAWENVMFNQFHDILCGCSIRGAYDDSAEFYGQSLALGAKILNGALQRISRNIDTSRGIKDIRLNKDRDNILWEADSMGVPVVVFNPLSKEVTVPVVINRKLSMVTDREDNTVCFQIVRGERNNGKDDRFDTLFMAHLPPLGYNTYWIYLDRPGEIKKPREKIGDNVLDNGRIKVVFNENTGLIDELIHGESKTNVTLGGACDPVVIDEWESDTWAHGIFSFRDEVGRFKFEKMEKIESGILRDTIRVFFRYNDSYLRLDYSLYEESDRVEVKAKVNWHEEHKMLKLSFPVAGTDHGACYEISSGFLKRPLNGEEEPGGRWVDLRGSRGGLAVLNDSKYSFDILDNDMRMTLLRSPAYADHFGFRDGMYEMMDQGIHYFKFALIPHDGRMEYYEITNGAQEFNSQFPIIKETYHEGFLDQEYGGIKVDTERISARVLKRSESGDELILRCYEQSGERVKANIELVPAKISFSREFGPFEIKTFKIDGISGRVKEVYIFEQGEL